ncbi:MAG TPA: hypothetical protein VLL97_15375 [Acidobacteriota bacterium]|nr:hypothetical protein [Acidobacteriota bacterium]
MRYACAIMSVVLLFGGAGATDPGLPVPADPPAAKGEEMTSEQIIQKFAEKETEAYEAWMRYAYTQISEIRVLAVDGRPQRESMTILSEVIFKDDGTREIHTVRRSGRLKSVIFTQEDHEVLHNINPFALTVREIPLYDIVYEGKERVDELECYVFSVKPKNMRRGRMYFEGRVWVDDQDFQVVRTIGKPVPQTRDQLFPEFETLRQIIDGRFWFPVWTYADSTLRFPGSSVRMEKIITYENYRRFESDAIIKYTLPE